MKLTVLWNYLETTSVIKKSNLNKLRPPAIAHNILGPASNKEDVEALQNDTFYSAATDVSNHGATKICPLMVRFYSPTINLKTCVLDFHEDANKTTSAIRMNLVMRLITPYQLLRR